MATDESVEQHLAHFGVKGMRWGRRKDKGNSAVPSSDDHTRTKSLRDRSVDSLSNDELRSLNERLNLESQNAKLTAGKSNAGAKFVTDALSNAAKTTLQNLAAQAMKQGLQFLIQRKFPDFKL